MCVCWFAVFFFFFHLRYHMTVRVQSQKPMTLTQLNSMIRFFFFRVVELFFHFLFRLFQTLFYTRRHIQSKWAMCAWNLSPIVRLLQKSNFEAIKLNKSKVEANVNRNGNIQLIQRHIPNQKKKTWNERYYREKSRNLYCCQ